MQTFLPYVDFERSARVLDTKRLGKQRVEVLQVLRALTIPTYGWQNHPAVLMWKGYEEALGRYGLVVVDAWCDLGFGDTCAASISAELEPGGVTVPRTQAELGALGMLPPWLGDEAVHRSHRSALLRKDPDWYRPHFPDEPDDLPYVWPVRSPKAVEAERKRLAREAAKAEARAEAGGRAEGAGVGRG